MIEHLLRRAGFGARPDEIAYYDEMSFADAVDELINYDRVAEDVDANIGKPGFAGTTSRGIFSPNSNLADA
ncbi:MAG: hypothetical protein HY655_08170, partial [Acidobacteria bacterium]|nr:hypothetical protein [Acidobacteriota bacterium]